MYARAIVCVGIVRAKTLYIYTVLTFCLWFAIEFFCLLRSRDGKYTGKKIFDGSSVYVRASVTRWCAGAKVFNPDGGYHIVEIQYIFLY